MKEINRAVSDPAPPFQIKSDATTSIYVHWPFCKSKCPYCDFNSHVRDNVDVQRMQAAYLRELNFFDDFLKKRTITSIFFGGGTPSLAPPALISSIIDELAGRYHLSESIEISLEANPNSVEAKNFSNLASAGVNRLSLGIQSLDVDALQFLGRQHSVQESMDAIKLAARYFPRYSLDFIYALPDQTLAQWSQQLDQIYDLSRGHLSLYQLTVEKGTPFYRQHLDCSWELPQEDLAADLYHLTYEYLQQKGLFCYEVSNYAAHGQECRHNINYWNYGDYIGIGAGAHGRYTKDGVKYASQMWSRPEHWLEQVEEHGAALQQHHPLTPQQMQQEQVMMGLRMSSGISKSLLAPENVLFLIDKGLLKQDGDNIATTERGRLLLNSILDFLLTTPVNL